MTKQPALQLLVLVAALLIGASAGFLTLTPEPLVEEETVEVEEEELEQLEQPEQPEPEPIYEEEAGVVSPVVVVRVLSHSEWLELYGPESLLAGFPNATSCGDCKESVPPEWWNFTLTAG